MEYTDTLGNVHRYFSLDDEQITKRAFNRRYNAMLKKYGVGNVYIEQFTAADGYTYNRLKLI